MERGRAESLTGLKRDLGDRERPSPPDLEGYLHKLKSNSRMIFSAWNKRWFRVNRQSESLEYFRNRLDIGKGVQPGGVIPLEDIESVSEYDSENFQFQIDSRKRTLFLQAESKADLTGWLTELQEYKRALQEYKRWHASHQAAMRYRTDLCKDAQAERSFEGEKEEKLMEAHEEADEGYRNASRRMRPVPEVDEYENKVAPRRQERSGWGRDYGEDKRGYYGSYDAPYERRESHEDRRVDHRRQGTARVESGFEGP